MSSFVRAAGYAAAVLGALVAPTFAAPSLALGLEAAPIEASYIDHATADLSVPAVEGEAADTPTMLTQDTDLSNELAQHALATMTGSTEASGSGKSAASLASLVDTHSTVSVDDSEMECLAGAIYFESKGEPLSGQLAVAEVIINRTKSGKYPATLCGIVKQPSQFSFVHGGRMPPIARDSAHWRKAVAIAHIARNDLADSPVPSATSFHATYVSPRWRMKRLATVGRHVFYR